MFLEGLNTSSEVFPTYWAAYVHATLVRAVSMGRQDIIQNWSAAAGGNQVYFSPADDSLLSGVAIVKDHQVGVVAFQGTLTTYQTLQQILNVTQGTFPGVPGTVNGYYGACFFERKAAFQNAINALPPGFRLYFTGHSAGGAIAQVAFNWFRYNSNITAWGCMTFGQPRAGNPTFANSTPRPYLRWIAQDDFIPGLPPNTFQAFALLGPIATNILGVNYRHARSGWLLMDNGTVRAGDSAIIDTWGPPLANPFLRLRVAWPELLNAHFLQNYTTLLLPLTRNEPSNPGLAQFVAMNAQMG